MRIYVSLDVMQILRIEIEKFGRRDICLIPVWVEGKEPKVWAMTDDQASSEAVAKFKSGDITILVQQKDLAELDGKAIVRGRRGFTTEEMNDSLRSQVTLFVGNL